MNTFYKFLVVLALLCLSLAADARPPTRILVDVDAVALAEAEAPASQKVSFRVLKPGMWTTDPAKCVGACVAIQNKSKTHCTAFGFSNGVEDEQLGKLVIVDGAGNGIGTWAKDGADADLFLDYAWCVPPEETVYGIVEHSWLKIKSRKYWTGNVSYTTTYLGQDITVFGQPYINGQGLPTVSSPGNPYNEYPVVPGTTMHIGG